MNAEEMASTLELVGRELAQVAAEVRTKGESKLLEWEGRWSTYTLEAYAAVYDLLAQDNQWARTLTEGDIVRVLWPNGHGYDTYGVQQTPTYARFRHLGAYEYQADGSVQKV